ncbi:uncharacterized protein G2W53_026917 [Senna tora]|uniref:Uncharacterized protein n=1 Tax=Senna tora TaxID=362788 RepID=A0A834THU3_9FABA|nr:uncharacterized protein G2W53_026917 [Senna tora]
MTQGSLPRSFKAIRVCRPAVDRVDRRPSKIIEPWICSDKMIPMTQASPPRSFKAIQVGLPVVDNVDRVPSKINESWVNIFSMQNLICICWVRMKPISQGNLPRNFKAIRLARGQIFDGRRRGLPSVGDAKISITHGSTFFYAQSHLHILR